MNKKITFLTIVFLLYVSKTNAQTWNIGYPDSTKVTATLTSKKLIIRGKGEMKNYPIYGRWKDKAISTVQIENGVTNIGNHAFYDCNDLKSISIPEGVTSIGESAFKNCENLEFIIIPNSITVIKERAFERCKSLKSFIIPNNVLQIEKYAFYECFNLKNVQLGSGLNKIGDCAFRACHNLSSITIPKSTKDIGDIAFRECYNMENYTVEEGNAQFSSVKGVLFNKRLDILLAYPNGKKGKYRIPDSTSVIGNSAFASSKINSVYIPKTVKIIKGDAFRYCDNLNKLKIPDSVEEIGVLSFASCNSLRRIELGNSINEINMYILSQNKNLLKIKISNKNLKFSSKKGILYNKPGDTLVMYPRGKKGGFMIPENVKCIKKGAFEACEGLTKIVIPESVTTIEDLAFQYSTNLIEVTNKSINPQLISNQVFSQKLCLFVPENAVTLYKKAKVWQDFVKIQKIEP
ncbi:leucine-rich repeat domain-containing protein [Flavobacterium plurextorum]|uniref:leucine-rich repeat domain-containing protein n=1 Tax=Flavobacterium plurextorum TaxID=1114867 RepID=UPI0037566EA0